MRRNFAFVTYRYPDDAKYAVRKLNKTNYKGSTIIV